MKDDQGKTKAQLMEELAETRQRVTELEATVTECERVDERLRKSQERYRGTLDGMLEGCQVIGYDWSYLYVNDAAAGQSRQPKETLLGHTMMEMYPDIENTEMFAALRRCMEKRIPHRMENEFTFANGAKGCFELSIEPVPDGIFILSLDVTERKRAEAALRESEERFRSVAETAINAIISADSHGTIVYWNRAAETIFGFSAGEAVGEPVTRIIPERLRKAQQEGLERAVSTGDTRIVGQIVEMVGLRKGGSEFPVELAVATWKTGGEQFFTVIARDISERKRAEEELRQSEAKYSTLVEQGNDGIIIIQDGLLRFANSKMVEMTGFSLEEAVDKPFVEFVSPQYGELVVDRYKRRISGEELPGNYEIVILAKDGGKIPVEINASRIEYGGRPANMAIIRDITERERTQEEAQRSRETLERIFESLGDGVVLLDLDGVITECNTRMAEMFGFKNRYDLIGKITPELVAENDRQRMLADVQETLDRGGAYAHEYTFLKADGSEFPGEVSGNALIDASGGVVGFISITRDITERRKMEEQLIVTDRLATIGELASGIAHELNNPLTSVIGFSELVMDKEVPENIRGHLEIIHREAKRTSGIVKNLLTFARRHAPTKEPVDIHRVVQAVLDLRAYEEKVNNIEVRTHFAPDLPEIIADRFQLQQVFLNIIINAEQAMLDANGRGTLTITSERSGEIVRISFADDGPGIREEDLGHIFDPFFTTKEVGKGTGLGLSICYGIVGEHGGRIYAESEVGRGTTFIVELPIGGQSRHEGND